MMKPAETNRPPPSAHRPLLAWHGLSLALPTDCGPVKIEGDATKGAVMIADLHAPRLGLRWNSPPRRRRFEKRAIENALRSEVGQLAAKEAIEHTPDGFTHGLLYVDPDPPGRDVWIGISSTSHRLVEVVWQAKGKSPTNDLRDRVLPTLADDGFDGPQRWSVFDFSLIAPAGWKLVRQRFNAGDLTMEFANRRSSTIVRQIGPARLALKRQTAEQWLVGHARAWKQMYGSAEMTNDQGPMTKGTHPERNGLPPSPGTPGEGGGEGLQRQGMIDARNSSAQSQIANRKSQIDPTSLDLIASRTLPRKRRYFFARWVASSRMLRLYRDDVRDRLYLLDADSERTLDAFLPGLGWAQRGEEKR
ncbi:MAG: hypothetical protein QM770_03450 [Tepidisphaeraceae bacterium]